MFALPPFRRPASGRYCLLLLSVVLTGCSRNDGFELVPVQGTVKLDGEPLADASVTFQPELGRPSLGRTDRNGNYDLQYTPEKRGALPGPNKVIISTYVEPDNDSDDPQIQAGKAERVPLQYNRRTQLEVVVEAGKSEPYDFDLQSK